MITPFLFTAIIGSMSFDYRALEQIILFFGFPIIGLAAMHCTVPFSFSSLHHHCLHCPSMATTTAPYQPYIDQLGSYAKTPYPAYSLASVFALCIPFSLPSGRDAARIPKPSPRSPLGAMLGPQIRNATALRGSMPPMWQLAGFATFFFGGGYMIDKGDSLNGAGTVTGRW